VSRELGPLDADDDPIARLRETLAVYFREGDVIAATAQRLGVHINTISYRLRQCEELLERPSSNGGSRRKPCCARASCSGRRREPFTTGPRSSGPRAQAGSLAPCDN
jgi:hypothetical protein